MAKTINTSFPDNDEELYEWVVEQAEEGPFANKSHVMRVAVQCLKDEGVSEYLV